MALDIWVWDPLRWTIVLTGLALGVVCGPCIAWSRDTGQRFRFLSSMVYGLLTAVLLVQGLGRGYAWYHWALAINGIIALVAQLHFVVKNALIIHRGGLADREGK